MSRLMWETHRNIIRWLDKPEAELRRKAIKAMRLKSKLTTWEELDYHLAVSSQWSSFLAKKFHQGL